MNESIQTFPGSRKIYRSGTRFPDVRVPAREIQLSDRAPVRAIALYDTSGPYSDPELKTDVTRGLSPLRGQSMRRAAPMPPSFPTPDAGPFTGNGIRRHTRKPDTGIRARRNRRRKGNPSGEHQTPGEQTMIIGRNFLVKINANIGNWPSRARSTKKSRKCSGPSAGGRTRSWISRRERISISRGNGF